MCDQQSLRPACVYAQSDQSLCLSLEYSLIIKLLTEHNLVFLSLKVGYTGSSESTLVKMQHCWESHATAHLVQIPVHPRFRTGSQEALSLSTLIQAPPMEKSDMLVYLLTSKGDYCNEQAVILINCVPFQNGDYS